MSSTPGTTSLRFYCTAPKLRIALDEFEALGQKRVSLLCHISPQWLCHSTFELQNKLLEFHELVQHSNADLLSHYALRLAFCRQRDSIHWNWFVTAEEKLLAVRLDDASPYEAVSLLSNEGIKYELLDDSNCNKLSTTQQGPFYRVPFTDAPALIRYREVTIQNGFCFVPLCKMNVVAVYRFRQCLEEQMRTLHCVIPAQTFELERLSPILDRFVAVACVSAVSMTKTASNSKLNVAAIDHIAEKHFPLCMKQLHRKLRENHHLKYDGRVQYRMFLKGAGFSVHDCIEFFRNEFIKKMPTAKFDKEYTYHIRHSYGLEGSRKDYAPLDCERIISGCAPSHGKYHGCPFKHWNRLALQDELCRHGVSLQTSMAITQQASTGHCQSACTAFFDETHSSTFTLAYETVHPDTLTLLDPMSSTNIAMHPNLYLNAKRMNASESKALLETTPSPLLPRQLDALNTSNSTLAQLLAILHELRHSVGPKVVNNAIAKVMKLPVETLEQGLSMDCRKKTKKEKQLLKQQRNAEKISQNQASVHVQQKKKKQRECNMSNYTARTVAIKFLYIGEKYAGFARQDHMPETVERYLFEALVRSKLIATIDDAGYSRCGRTDRGVSAFGQVVALRVRSNLPNTAELISASSINDVCPGEQFQVRLVTGEIKTLMEVDYASHLNRALPADIRVYSVASCHPEFSARFHCKTRMYRYFFVRRNLDIDTMRTAAQCLVGKHDFRNFCRIDPNCHMYERNISSFEIVAYSGQHAADPSQQLYYCEVFGRAFLWHQVRCMVEVLFLIGSGSEEPSIIPQLLDITQTPRKPQYDMAPGLPLVLHDCLFADPKDTEAPDPRFEYTPLALLQVHAQLTETWEKRCVQAAMLRSYLDALEAFQIEVAQVVKSLDHYAPKLEQLMRERNLLTDKCTMVQWKDVIPLLPLSKKRKTLPLMKRGTGHSVEECKWKALERKRRRVEEQKDARQISEEATAKSGDCGEHEVTTVTLP